MKNPEAWAEEKAKQMLAAESRLRILRGAVVEALNPYQGHREKTMRGCVPCPRCGDRGGTLLAHMIGCEVWDALYG